MTPPPDPADPTTPGTVTPGTVTPGTVTPDPTTPATVTPGTVTPGTVTPGTVTPGTVAPGGIRPSCDTADTDGACASTRPLVVVLHSSDEHYGSDRVLLDVLDVLDRHAEVLVLVPDDTGHGPAPLCRQIHRRLPHVHVDHVALPVLRRSAITPRALARIVVGCITLGVRLRRLRPVTVWCATSAVLPGAMSARLVGVHSVVVHVHEIWSGPSRLLLRTLGRFATARIAVSAAAERSARTRRPAGRVIANSVAEPTADPTTEPTTDPTADPTTDPGAADTERTTTPTHRTPEHRTPEHPSSDPGVGAAIGAPPQRWPRFLVASRWGWWKGHATLFAAWDLAGCPGHLTVLGGPPPTGGGVDVPTLAGRLVRDPSSITIVGEVADIDHHLADTDVVVVPSDRPEPFGLVVVEAFARGIPVIATRAGGVPDIVTDGVDGWLVTPGDVTAMAAALRSIDPHELERAGRRARTTHLSRFTPEMFRRELHDVVGTELARATRGTTPATQPRRTAAWPRPTLHTRT